MSQSAYLILVLHGFSANAPHLFQLSRGGHALVALYTPGAYPLQSITVVPRGNALGYALFLPEMDKNSHTLAEYRAKLDVAFGGRIAEELIYGPDNVTDGASSDISSATSIARNMVRRFGFSEAVGPVAYAEVGEGEVSSETRAVIEGEVRRLVEGAQERARRVLGERRVELERLAEALMEHETLDLGEVKRVIKGEKIVKRMEWEREAVAAKVKAKARGQEQEQEVAV